MQTLFKRELYDFLEGDGCYQVMAVPNLKRLPVKNFFPAMRHLSH